ncbi:hypothetical protein [Magnetospirillum sulfuroxidans]|uniref:Photoactive yellow protein n=1 Tax=Magnetospirillum sulfuroxidans TaxID=611300 RepID=A0ABS5I8A8_9PROT|nr:hypothetical protein [Magnetospirillum sulfuroxidans]MBR9970659.1 hypothetical protein [Magnetospirillum sulfuroxidans]
MTVFAFAQDDPENPLLRLSVAEVERLPFGAAELDRDGAVVSYIDTEPGDRGPAAASKGGAKFFAQIAPWAGASMIAEEFRRGVDGDGMNVVFDCAVENLAYKVRIHLKTSPILGTFWIFIKKLTRH